MKRKSQVDSGTLHIHASIMRTDDVEDEFAGRLKVPTLFAYTWLKVRPVYAYEAQRFASQKMEVTHLVTARYIAGVTAKMWLEFRGRRLNIQGVTNIEEDNRLMLIFCSELLGIQ